MKLMVSKTKNAASLYVIESVYKNKVNSSRIVEKLGTYDELLERLDGGDPYEWAREYIAELNRQQEAGREPDVVANYSPSRRIEKDVQQSFQGGYLFLQKLYYAFGLHRICADITRRHKIEYDLNAILSALLYTRVLHPGSKKSAHEISRGFLEAPSFDLHQVYRALDVISEESDFIQAQLYKKSLKVSKRNTGVLYYDCTNYFFETEQEDGLRRYGVSKEHRPNPIVQMGLFMDGDGMPLAFCIHPGNTNEQRTLKPLEQQILSDFEMSKFIVCTDAGLSSTANRRFNNHKDLAYITTQSIKKLKQPLQEWVLEPEGWRLADSQDRYDLREIDEKEHRHSIFYKEQWVEIGGLTQRMLVSYNPKQGAYQASIRKRQIERALQAMEGGKGKLTHSRQNDYKRFVQQTHCTGEGEIARQTVYSLNEDAIEKEAAYDGFYAVCTNLQGKAHDIIRINKRRWEIEECFRIMKSEFSARPVYLSRDNRIKAHFMTCFLALFLYRALEKKLGQGYTAPEILDQLRHMQFQAIQSAGYAPAYTRTDLTDSLHEAFGFRTDNEIVTHKQMKAICKATKTMKKQQKARQTLRN